MTKEDWTKAEKSLSWTGAFVKLNCDGYIITIKRERFKELVDCYFVYVNGEWKWVWGKDDCEERRRFARARTYFVHPPKERTRLKKLSKSTRKLMGPYFDPDKNHTVYTPIWRSFKALKAHLIKNNKEISLFEEKSETVEASTARGA